MTTEDKLIALITGKAKEILTTNEFAQDRSYSTNIGNSVKEWLGINVDEDNEDERLEIRDVEGEPVDDELPIGKEQLALHFAVYKKTKFSSMATKDDVAIYLRKIKADIYRMIGSNIEYFRTELNNFGLVFSRGKWSRYIDTAQYVYGETLIEILVQYDHEDEWLLNEQEY